MTIALVAHTMKGSSDSFTVTTNAIDSTGANFAAIAASFTQTMALPIDSFGNVYTGLTAQTASGSETLRWYYCENPTVGSGHTATATPSGGSGFPTASLNVFSGVATSSSFDVQNGVSNALSVSSLQTGSITPSAGGELLLYAAGDLSTSGTVAVDTGAILDQVNLGGGLHFALATAYEIQTTATTRNPTFSSGTFRDAAIASFKSGGGPPPATNSGRFFAMF